MDVREAVLSAWRRGSALLAVNAINLETAQGIVWGAERVGRPIILMVSRNAGRYAGLEEMAFIGMALKRKASVPIFLHYDHAEGPEEVEEAFRLGFESAMLEVHSPEVLAEVRRLARGRPLEVELEVVAKGERRGSARELEELLALSQLAGADWVVVQLGTVHKDTRARRLDLGRLEALRGLGRPLVLHGGSSAHPEDLRQAVKGGVAKVNVATAAFRAFSQGLREHLQEEDPREYLGPAREALATWVAGFYAGIP